jgi:predicted tellurium resistance membrane protein TerC
MSAIMPPANERTLSYAVALACVLAGVALVTRLILPAVPAPLSAGFGAILVLLGINRYLVTRWKQRMARRRHWSDDANR